MNRFSFAILFLFLLPIASSAQPSQRPAGQTEREIRRDKQAAIETEAYKKQVSLSFAHYGVVADQLESRIEANEPRGSKSNSSFDPLRLGPPESKPVGAVWLRLRNDSPLPIRIPSSSVYTTNAKCSFEFSAGTKVFGFCDGSEIGIWFGLEGQDRLPMPYAFDPGANAILLPNTSVLFAVRRAVLEQGNAIRFDFVFLKDDGANKVGDYGTPKPLKFRESDLPLVY